MRKIKIFTTKGTPDVITVADDVTTWAQLKPLVKAQVGSLDNLQATENIGKTTLIQDEAVLPQGDFILFLRPKKTKAGADYSTMDRKQLAASLSQAQKDQLKAETGKNWTNCPTETIRELLIKGGSPKKSAVAAKVEKVKATPVEKEKVAAPVNQVTSTKDSDESLENAIGTLQEIATNYPNLAILCSDTIDNLSTIAEAVANGGEIEESEEERERRENEEAMREFNSLKD